MIKMVNEFKLTVVHFACPNPMQICACAWIYSWTKNCGKSGLGHWAIAGHWAFGPLGPRAVMGRGPLGHGPAFSKIHRIHDLFYY